MARIISWFILAFVNCDLSDGLKRTVKWVYKPYGPQMCGELCEDLAYSFLYMLEDLSCHRIAKNVTFLEMPPSEGRFRCAVQNTSDTIPVGRDMCKTNDGDYTAKSKHLAARSVHDNVNANISLHTACEEGSLEVVKSTISNSQENINIRDKLGRTPVMVAAQYGQAAVFDFLVSQNCDLLAVDDNHNTVLHVACIGGRTDIVKKLLDTGKYDIDAKESSGWTPVMIAARYGHTETVILLMSKNCSLKVVGHVKETLLHAACAGGHVDLVKRVLSLNIVSIESEDSFGRTPLMLGVLQGHRGVFNLLQCSGSNLTALDKQGDNVLHLSCWGGHVGIVNYVLSLNIFDIDCRGFKERTPVMVAAGGGYKGIVALLVSKGCNLKVADVDQNNILHLACLGGHVEMVTYLITIKTVDGRGWKEVEWMERRKNKYGRTPLQVAKNMRHTSVVSLFNPLDARMDIYVHLCHI